MLVKLAAMFEKPIQKFISGLHVNGCLFMWGAYFCMGAYKHWGCHIQNGYLYS